VLATPKFPGHRRKRDGGPKEQILSLRQTVAPSSFKGDQALALRSVGFSKNTGH